MQEVMDVMQDQEPSLPTASGGAGSTGKDSDRWNLANQIQQDEKDGITAWLGSGLRGINQLDENWSLPEGVATVSLSTYLDVNVNQQQRFPDNPLGQEITAGLIRHLQRAIE